MNQDHRASKEMMVCQGRLDNPVARVLMVGLGFLVKQDPKGINHLYQLCQENQEIRGNLVVLVHKADQVIMDNLVLLDHWGHRVYLGH